MTSVLILQGIFAKYREPLFRALAERYDLTILHAGERFPVDDAVMKQVIVPASDIGPFRWQDSSSVREEIDSNDVVIAMSDIRWPAYWLPLLSRNRPPYILHGHRYSRKFPADAIRDWLMKKADCLLQYGEDEIERMVSRGIDPQKIRIAPNTVEVANHLDFSGRDKSSLLYMGRLQDRKRLDIAINAFADLQGIIPDHLRFDIIGDGPPRGELEILATELGIADKVRFHGAIHDNAVLADYFADALLYVSPGPVGLAVLHSFAFGVPVLTLRDGYHGPEFHNIVHDRNSLIAEDEAHFKTLLEALCNDPQRARAMGNAAYRLYSEERTIENLVDAFVEAIENVAVGAKTRRAVEPAESLEKLELN